MNDPAEIAAADAAGPGSDDMDRADAPILSPGGAAGPGDVESAAFEALSAAPDTPGTSRRCSRCQADLDRLSLTARFCPRCGLTLKPPTEPLASVTIAATPSANASAVTPPELPPVPTNPAASAAAWLRIRQAGPAAKAVGPTYSVPGTDTHSAMLLGYANAMYRLGWRYETGQGTGRNVEEAIRCYFKAAKLGNPAALARLAPQCAGGDGNRPGMQPPDSST